MHTLEQKCLTLEPEGFLGARARCGGCLESGPSEGIVGKKIYFLTISQCTVTSLNLLTLLDIILIVEEARFNFIFQFD